jgi:hypothetical protein
LDLCPPELSAELAEGQRRIAAMRLAGLRRAADDRLEAHLRAISALARLRSLSTGTAVSPGSRRPGPKMAKVLGQAGVVLVDGVVMVGGDTAVGRRGDRTVTAADTWPERNLAKALSRAGVRPVGVVEVRCPQDQLVTAAAVAARVAGRVEVRFWDRKRFSTIDGAGRRRWHTGWYPSTSDGNEHLIVCSRCSTVSIVARRDAGRRMKAGEREMAGRRPRPPNTESRTIPRPSRGRTESGPVANRRPTG